MSSNIDLEIEGPTLASIPDEEGIKEFLKRAEAGRPDFFGDAPSSDHFRWVLQWWDQKYIVVGDSELFSECEALSALFPEATITIQEEWTDDVGGVAYEWQGGFLIRTAEMKWVWEDLREGNK